jgi:hypothetical protein
MWDKHNGYSNVWFVVLASSGRVIDELGKIWKEATVAWSRGRQPFESEESKITMYKISTFLKSHKIFSCQQ